MTRERLGGLAQRIARESLSEVTEQGACDTRCSTAAGSQFRDFERRCRRCRSETLVQSKPPRDDVECFAIALQCQQSINKVGGQAIGVAGVGPGCDALAQPMIVLDGVAARCEPVL